MNTALILLWVLVVVSVIGLIIAAAFAMRKWSITRSITTLEPIGACRRPFNTITDISGLPCCVVGSRLTARRYVENLDNTGLNMVVSPAQTPYLEACAGFCGGQTVINERGETECSPETKSGQAEFAKCVTLTRPQNCTGAAMPVAAINVQYFYALEATNENCRITESCG